MLTLRQDSVPSSNRNGHIAAVSAALIWLACGSLYLTLPPSPDQFNHAYLGWRLLQGSVPYRDVIDMNWPGVIWLHALATGIFGANIWSWRALDYLLFGASSILLCSLVRRAAGARASNICAMTSPVLYVTSGYWLAGQHDMSAAQFLVFAVWAHVRGLESPAVRWQVLAGSMLAAAMLNKPTVGVMLPLLALHARLLGLPAAQVAAHLAAATVALLATLAAAAASVVSLGTSWQELLDATITYNASPVAAPELFAGKPRSLIEALVKLHFWRWAELTLASAPALIWIARQTNRSPAGTALVLFWLAGVISYLIQARGYTYHLAPAFMTFVALVPISVDRCRQAWRRPSAPFAARTTALLVLGALLVGQTNRLVQSYRALPLAIWQNDPAGHYARFKANDGISVAEAVALSRRLKQAAGAECLLLVGTGSAINYLSELRQPTRFYYFPMIERAVAPLPMAEEWQKQWAADLADTTCPYVLVASVVERHWLNRDQPASRALASLLTHYSKVDDTLDSRDLVAYRRK